MKTKEEKVDNYIAMQYIDYGDLSYQAEEQMRESYLAGYEEAEELFKPKWINVEEQTPEDDRAVLVKTKDYRRPQYDVTDVQIGYLENEVWYYNEGGEINSGLGWHLTHWMEIPK